MFRPPSLPPKPKATRRLGKIPKEGQPKLFGGSIEEYVEVFRFILSCAFVIIINDITVYDCSKMYIFIFKHPMF